MSGAYDAYVRIEKFRFQVNKYDGLFIKVFISHLRDFFCGIKSNKDINGGGKKEKNPRSCVQLCRRSTWNYILVQLTRGAKMCGGTN